MSALTTTTYVETTLDHELRVRMNDLPPTVISHMRDALTIPNLEKQKALKQFVPGAERMPDSIDLWRLDGEDNQDFVMPRGFAQFYADGMRDLGIQIKWIDNRVFKTKLRIGQEPKLRPWQVPAVETMRECHQGIYKAPAGSGKTVAILALIQKLACKSIVIVNTKDIVWQWNDRSREFLGPDYGVGQIGDGIFDVSPYLTIATEQTLHSRFDALEADGFFEEFSLVCLDECHHATAETYWRVLNRFSARYRLGVSATPDKTGDFALATNVLGPIIHETLPSDVTSLQKPEVIRIPTKFGFPFRGTKSRWQRSNYAEMINALIRNEDRNFQIVYTIIGNEGHHQLVVSKRLEHLEILHDMLIDEGFIDPIVTITGQDDNEVRQQAKALAESRPCVLLSTLADEAMDIPRLDRLHLVFPQRNTGLITQQVGRVERKHPEKADAIIYDYWDGNVGPLNAQWRVRSLEVYKARRYRISTRRSE
jgi:superfamily II DNA or RNA helicase